VNRCCGPRSRVDGVLALTAQRQTNVGATLVGAGTNVKRPLSSVFLTHKEIEGSSRRKRRPEGSSRAGRDANST
jgi:hypothetical protein